MRAAVLGQEEHARIDKMAVDIGEIKGELNALLEVQVPRVVKDSSLLAPEKLAERAPVLQANLRVAKSNKIAIDPATLQKLGSSLVEAHEKVPGSEATWNAFSELVSYRTFLNAQHETGWSKSTESPPRELPPGITNIVADSMEVGGGPIDLDGLYWMNDVFKNCVIRYRGGPVVLKNVRFENCTFVMLASEPAKRLGTEVLSAEITNFQNKAS